MRLANGSVWEIQNEYSYLYQFYPPVIVCPSRSLLVVTDKQLNARQLSSGSSSAQPQVIEAFIESNFSGLNLGNIYRLSNGEIWEQTEAWVWARPKVLIYKGGNAIKMKVENIDHAVTGSRIR